KSCGLCRELAAYREKLQSNWDDLEIQELTSPSASILKIGEKITLTAKVDLSGMEPDEVGVELYYGSLSSEGEIENPRRLPMRHCGTDGDEAVFCAEIVCDRTGRQGYTVRVLPSHPALVHPFLPGLVKWG
ncbi:MAG TPA: alpha-glucan phosphorylase, partial [Spirochaetia bacterium]|nr:alpha-glucan phosphorylase [Spirochaetia bacterium]